MGFRDPMAGALTTFRSELDYVSLRTIVSATAKVQVDYGDGRAQIHFASSSQHRAEEKKQK